LESGVNWDWVHMRITGDDKGPEITTENISAMRLWRGMMHPTGTVEYREFFDMEAGKNGAERMMGGGKSLAER